MPEPDSGAEEALFVDDRLLPGPLLFLLSTIFIACKFVGGLELEKWGAVCLSVYGLCFRGRGCCSC
jgi:hypothetical protein